MDRDNYRYNNNNQTSRQTSRSTTDQQPIDARQTKVSDPKNNLIATPRLRQYPRLPYKILIFYSCLLTILLIISIVLNLVIYRQIKTINTRINDLSTSNISHQIQFDCQAIAILPQNCR